MSTFCLNSLFTALPSTRPLGSVTTVSSLFKQEILHEMLAFCTRPELELCSIYSSTLYQLVKNHFPTAPYNSFHQLHISTSQGSCGLTFCKEKNQTFRLRKNNAKVRRSQKQRGEPISYDTPFHMLYPYLKSTTIRMQETTLNMDSGGFTQEVQKQLKCLAHLWVNSKFTLQVTQLSRLESSSEEYHSLLGEVFLSGLLNSSQLVLKFNFPTIELKMDWTEYKVLYSCDVLELDNFNHCISKQELADIVHGIPKERQEDLVIIYYFNYFNSEMTEKKFDLSGFLNIVSANFLDSIKPQPFELRIVFFNCRKVRVQTLHLINEFSRETLDLIEEQNFKGYTLKRMKIKNGNTNAKNNRNSLRQINYNDIGIKFI